MHSVLSLTMRSAALSLLMVTTAAAAAVQIRVSHTDPGLLGPVHAEIERRFEGLHPEINLVFDAAVREYEEQTRNILRDALVGRAPDVAFAGLHRVGLLAERGHAVALDPFIAAEPDWKALGYPPASLELAAAGGKVYGLPFAISIPIVFYNPELVARAGGDPESFPATWPELIDLAARIEALGEPITGGFFEYDNSGNWTFQALLTSQGARMMSGDGRTIRFDGPEGIRALEIFRAFGERAGQIAMSRDAARTVFASGTLGMIISSSASLGSLTKAIAGRFELRTAPMPLIAEGGRLPGGGNAAVMMTTDPEKQKAAWTYIKYATGPEGQTIMVPRTGYMSGNEIPMRKPKLLGDFYAASPNHMTAASQLGRVTAWYSFPGENALKITDVIKGHLQQVITLQATPEEAMAAMVADTKDLLAGR